MKSQYLPHSKWAKFPNQKEAQSLHLVPTAKGSLSQRLAGMSSCQVVALDFRMQQSQVSSCLLARPALDSPASELAEGLPLPLPMTGLQWKAQWPQACIPPLPPSLPLLAHAPIARMLLFCSFQPCSFTCFVSVCVWPTILMVTMHVCVCVWLLGVPAIAVTAVAWDVGFKVDCLGFCLCLAAGMCHCCYC